MTVGPVEPGRAPGVQPAAAPAAAPSRRAAAGPAFADVLQARLDGQAPLRFSGHALERIQRRAIDVDGAVGARLAEGVSRAAAKGARDSLVLVDDTAFVVSVRNRTVITAVDREHMREQVFTNIDSAVIA
jgi:flagellar operon protein